MDPTVESSWKSKIYSALSKDTISLVGKSMGTPRATSRGFCTPSYWGWANEIGPPTMIFWQKATKGLSLANPHGAPHAIDVLTPY